jgi:RNA polymerase sigma factor (sigma-70 family)
MKMTDSELLRRYARERSENAFEELVRRRINLVYSSALRQVNNDTGLAEDVAQAVFTDLARKAAKLSHHPSLIAWLYTSTRFAATNIRRAERRRAAREEEAYAMNANPTTTESEPDWAQIRPLLDDAMHTLDAQDCQAVLLRHFERCSYIEIGARIGLSEDAARMRVNRALEKLRDGLAKRGVTSTSLALAAFLGANAVGAAPAHLAAKTASTAMMATAGAGGLSFLLASKVKLMLAAVIAALGVAIIVLSRRGGVESVEVLDAGKPTNAQAAAVASPTPPVSALAVEALSNRAVLHLQIVTADTGKPIPDVSVDYFVWASIAQTRSMTLRSNSQTTVRSDRLGVCDVTYPDDVDQLELVTGKAPFADTRLLWRRPLGDVIPTHYVLRVERAVPIGGTVVDDDGNAVPGASVTWSFNEPSPDTPKPSPSHEYYGTTFEATTDQAGRWQINRLADAIVPYLIGQAKEPDHTDTDFVSTDRDRSVEQQLRAGAYIFKLKRGMTANGEIVDTNGAPIPDATVIVGNRIGKSRRDGRFSVNGCMAGTQPLTAKAPGFPPATVIVDLRENADPVRLVLRPGKSLRLRIVDQEGSPISNAFIYPIGARTGQPGWLTWFDTSDPGWQWTDQEGRISWTNVPDAELHFKVSAPGFGPETNGTIHPDGQEHEITLSLASP